MSSLIVVALVLAVVGVARQAVARSASARARGRLAQPNDSRRGPDLRVPPRVQRAFDRAGLPPRRAAQAWRGWMLGGTSVVVAATLAAGGAAAALALFLVVVAPAAALWSARHRGSRRYEAAVPPLLDEMAAELRAGSSLLVALGAAGHRTPGPLGADVRAVVDAVEQGAPLLPELDDWARARPVAAVRLASAAVAVGAANGGRQARAIEAVATTLRERAAVHHEAVGLATQARASALLMTVTPIVFAIVASIVDPPLGHVLLHTPLGLGCLAIGLALDGAAAAWMAQITGGHS